MPTAIKSYTVFSERRPYSRTSPGIKKDKVCMAIDASL